MNKTVNITKEEYDSLVALAHFLIEQSPPNTDIESPSLALILRLINEYEDLYHGNPSEYTGRPKTPCRHPGCAAHVTHPCEECGYQAILDNKGERRTMSNQTFIKTEEEYDSIVRFTDFLVDISGSGDSHSNVLEIMFRLIEEWEKENVPEPDDNAEKVSVDEEKSE